MTDETNALYCARISYELHALYRPVTRVRRSRRTVDATRVPILRARYARATPPGPQRPPSTSSNASPTNARDPTTNTFKNASAGSRPRFFATSYAATASVPCAAATKAQNVRI